MRVTPITTAQGLRDLQSAWHHLAGRMPLRSWHWLAGWWQRYGTAQALAKKQGQPLVLCVHDDQSRLVGLAPWYVESSMLYGRVVRFLGSGDVSTDHLSLLCATGHEGDVSQAIAEWLLQPARGGDPLSPETAAWGLLDFSGVDAADRNMALLVEALRQRRAIVHSRPGTSCWRLTLPESWDEYLMRLSKCQRKHVRRLQRNYFESGRTQLHFAESDEQLDKGLEILTGLHRLRWQSRGEQGVFSDATFLAFHQSVARQFLCDGRLRLSWLELDNRPVAAEYQFTGDGVLYAYQSGMDPAAAEHQPGNLSMIATLRWAMQNGCTAVDLLRGDEPYKAHWGFEPQPMLQIRVVPGKWSGWLRHQLWATARRAKRAVSSARRSAAETSA